MGSSGLRDRLLEHSTIDDRIFTLPKRCGGFEKKPMKEHRRLAKNPMQVRLSRLLFCSQACLWHLSISGGSRKHIVNISVNQQELLSIFAQTSSLCISIASSCTLFCFLISVNFITLPSVFHVSPRAILTRQGEELPVVLTFGFRFLAGFHSVRCTPFRRQHFSRQACAGCGCRSRMQSGSQNVVSRSDTWCHLLPLAEGTTLCCGGMCLLAGRILTAR